MIDKILNKIIPKKFIAFILATIFLCIHLIDGQQWLYITVIYLVSNALAKKMIPSIDGNIEGDDHNVNSNNSN